MSVPKIIHYCWFGRGELPKDAKQCIASWHRFLPDYEIRVWNEDNFDINCCPYVAEAYAARKYAFVSDYARFRALYDYGGVYFDTDVEVLNGIGALIDRGPMMGIEKSLATNGSNPDAKIGVAPGLGVVAEKGMPFLKEILDYYDNIHFDINEGTVVYHTTRLLTEKGLKNENKEQQVAGFIIYPDDVLCPMDSTTGLVHRTDRTVAIHHYSCSWMDHKSLSFRLHLLKNKLVRIFGPKTILTLSRLLHR